MNKYIEIKTKADMYARNMYYIYILFSVFVTIIGRIIPLKNTIGANIEGVMYDCLAVVGMLLLITFLVCNYEEIHNYYIKILSAFIIVMVISSLVNMKYGITNNIKTLVWSSIQFGVIFAYPLVCDKDSLSKAFRGIWKLISFIWLFPVLFSIVQFIKVESYWTEVDDGRWIRQGFIENRLFGIFNDPNYAAMISVCVIIVLVYFLTRSKKWYQKLYFLINIIVQALFITLSGSRTALVCMTVAFCCGIYMLRSNMLLQNKIKKNMIAILLIPILVIGGIMAINEVNSRICLKISAYYLENIHSTDSHIQENISKDHENDASKEHISNENIHEAGDKQEITLDREDVKKKDISNNRGKIWKEYLRLLEKDFLLGGSPRNFMQKWVMKSPNGYLGETSYETHNGYLSVLMGTGILGFMCVLLFIGRYAKELFFLKKVFPKEIICIVMLLCVASVFAFFFTDLFFIHSFTSVLFWFHCGISIKWMKEEQF